MIGPYRPSSLLLINTVIGTCVGAATIMGTMENILNVGIHAVWPIFFISVPILFLFIFPPSFPLLKKYKTVGGAFGGVYNKKVSLLFSVSWLAFCIGILVVQNMALCRLFSTMTGLSFSQSLFILWPLVFFYTTYGGIEAVIKTDYLQTLIIYLFLIVFLLTLWPSSGGNSFFDLSFQGNLPPLFTKERFIFSFDLMVGPLFSPPIIQRYLLSGSEKKGRRVMLGGSFGILVLILLNILVGSFLSSLAHEKNLSFSSVFHLLEQLDYSPLFMDFFLVMLLSAILSSIDSLLNSCEETLINDLQDFKIQKIGIYLLGITVMILTYFSGDSLWSALTLPYKYWAAVWTVPMGFLLLSKKKKIPTDLLFLTQLISFVVGVMFFSWVGVIVSFFLFTFFYFFSNLQKKNRSSLQF